MEEFFGRPAARAVAVVVIIGALLGIARAVRSPAPTPAPPAESPVGPTETGPVFASYFVHFFPGRTHDGTRPTGRKQLLRAARFLTGERAGIRAQAAAGVDRSFVVGIRFLTRDTREETPALRDDRQSFRIRPGLRTYCCLRMPKEPGDYTLAVIAGGEFIAHLPISVKEPPFKLEGGLLQPSGDE